MKMDMWKYYDITHRHHVICNPTSEEKLARLVDLVKLPSGASVVDIACGKGEFLFRLAETYGVSGAGVDLSPFCVAEVQEKLGKRAPGSALEVLAMDGAEFKPDEPNSLALASCLGASWVYKGHAGTLKALAGMVAPGGWVIAGEPFWLKEPANEYLEVAGFPQEAFGTHEGNAEAGEQFGLELVHTLVSSHDDWDRYEGLQWYATDEYVRTHPDDPDVPELTERIAKEKMMYLKWARDSMGWAVYLFRSRPA